MAALIAHEPLFSHACTADPFKVSQRQGIADHPPVSWLCHFQSGGPPACMAVWLSFSLTDCVDLTTWALTRLCAPVDSLWMVALTAWSITSRQPVWTQSLFHSLLHSHLFSNVMFLKNQNMNICQHIISFHFISLTHHLFHFNVNSYCSKNCAKIKIKSVRAFL